MVIPRPRRSRRSAEYPHTAPTATARWSSIKVAMPSSSSVPTRMVFLLHGEDPFRTRLRLGELAAGLLSGAPAGPTDLGAMVEPRLAGAARTPAPEGPFATPRARRLSAPRRGP